MWKEVESAGVSPYDGWDWGGSSASAERSDTSSMEEEWSCARALGEADAIGDILER